MHALVQGEGAAVVTIHGAHGSALDFSLRVAPLLADRYTVVAMDRPGAGRSGRPPGAASPRAQAGILRAAVQSMGFSRPILVGHSLGAPVALAWALDDADAVRAVVTVGGYVLTAGRYRPPLARLLGTPAGPLLAATVVPALGRTLGPAVLRRAFLPERIDEEYARLALANALTPAHLLNDAADRRAVDDGLLAIQRDYGRLEPPLVAVAGLRDAVVSPWQSRRLVELVPHGELVLLPETGHLPQVTKPGAVAAAVERADALAACREERPAGGPAAH